MGAGAVGEIPLDDYPHLAKLLKATLWRSGAAQAHLEGARLGAFILMATRGATPSPTAEQVPRLAAAAEGVLKAAAEGDPAAFAAVLLELADEFSYGDTESSASAAGLAVADSIVGLVEDLGGAVAAALAPAAPKRKKRPPAAAGAAAKKARPEPDSIGDVLAESDDDSEDSYDEEDGEVEEPAHVTPAKRKHVTIAGVTDAEAASGAESDGDGLPRAQRRASAARELRTIKPAELSALKAAAAFFRGRAMLDVAGVSAEDISELKAELGAAAPTGDKSRLELRFGAALGRLVARIGEFRGPNPPEDATALVELAEAALDKAVQLALGGARPAGAAGLGDGGVGGQFGAASLQQPHLGDGLSWAQQRNSVSAEVAASLRPHAGLLHQQWAGDVGNGISMAPRDIRDDLRRATLSSGKVHAPGAAKHVAHLPPTVSAMR